MDSKLRNIALAVAVLVIVAVTSVMVICNWDTVKKKLGFRDQIEIESVEVISPTEETTKPNGQIGNSLYAWKRDETFFDVDNSSLAAKMLEDMKRLSLMITSVERDLRILVVDSEGNPVKDKEFYINIRNVGEYKDLDKDGILYIADLKPGEYYVSLKPIEDYIVPSNEMQVKVKENVEFLVIDDITYLMKTEADINAEREDTGTNSADNDADKSQYTDIKTLGTAVYGIDVSKWNQDIDWEKVAESGIQFAIVRAGYRGSESGALVIDPFFEVNMREATRAGIEVGAYFFSQAVNEVEAVEEASMLLSLCGDYNVTYPLIIDTEGAGGSGRADGLDTQTRTAVCEAFCQTIKNAGYTAGVYASKNWLEKNVDARAMERYLIWLAEYKKIPKFQGYYEMWQYTSKGQIDGIKGNVDLNVSYIKKN